MAKQDFFKPTFEPARSIYIAFQEEAVKRDKRDKRDDAVWQADKLGLRRPTLADVEQAEQYALGSADYGAKWAYGVVDAMQDESASNPTASTLP